jgi:hypothetical protein
MIGTAKTTMKKCRSAGEDQELAFLFLRTTPGTCHHQVNYYNYEHPIRSTLPFTFKLKGSYEDTKAIFRQQQLVQKQYFDNRGTKELKPLRTGESVMIQHPCNLTWKPGIVASTCEEPRSYIIQTTDGERYRRNRRFLRSIPPPVPRIPQRPEGTEEQAPPASPPDQNPRRSMSERKHPERLIENI